MSADNPTPDVQQFQDDEGGPLRSWYAAEFSDEASQSHP